MTEQAILWYKFFISVSKVQATMPVTPDQPAPYAPAKAIMSLVERHRARGLPSPVDHDVLARAGISESLIPRTLQALQTLDLLTSEGHPSPVLEGIRVAPEAEYQARLSDWLNGTYADALQFVDPATADETAIRDAFRNYRPVGQQDRMVSLFSGLFRAAGIAPDRPASNARPRAPGGQSKPRATIRPAPKPPQESNVQHEGAPQRRSNIDGALHPALAGLLASLPGDEGWTKAERDRFVATFGTVLDFCFPPRSGIKHKNMAEEVDDDPA